MALSKLTNFTPSPTVQVSSFILGAVVYLYNTYAVPTLEQNHIDTQAIHSIKFACKFQKLAYICSNRNFLIPACVVLLKRKSMQKSFFLIRVFHFYREGFREMTLGKTLWFIILIKLFIMFFVLKLFFFPSYLSRFDTKGEKEEHVSGELIHRAITP